MSDRLTPSDIEFPTEPPVALVADSAEDSRLRLVRRGRGIAFVGTYAPRRCGIATFTSDLSNAIVSAGEQMQPISLALTDPGGRYDYPENVKYEIRQGVK